jgi:hypothetical protein
MTELTTSNNTVTEPRQQLSVAQVMDTALAPYQLMVEWNKHYWLTRRLEVERLTNRNDDGRYIALENAKTSEERFRVHCDAYDVRDELPALQQTLAVLKTIDRTVTTKPTYLERKLLIGMMLDGCGLKADEGTAAYVEAVAWTLGACEPRSTEKHNYSWERKAWMPLPAVAAAVKQVWLTQRDNYGRPIPIADFLDECGKQTVKLLDIRGYVVAVARTTRHLTKLIDATEDSYPPDEPEEPSKH